MQSRLVMETAINAAPPAVAPNPSIERTSPDKPGLACYVKRWQHSMHRALALVLLASTVGAQGADGKQKFASFVVNPHEAPELKYQFSEAAATSGDPIVISAVGRRLLKSDLENRTDLQRVWLRRNVPETHVIQMRTQVGDCGMIQPGDFHHCDLYQFKDSKTGKIHAYYIYIGNWPFV